MSQERLRALATRTLVILEVWMTQRHLGRHLTAATQGYRTEACQRQQRPARLRGGGDADVTSANALSRDIFVSEVEQGEVARRRIIVVKARPAVVALASNGEAQAYETGRAIHLCVPLGIR